MKFECVQCGNCCKGFDVDATIQDVKKWRELGRYDIIEKFIPILEPGGVMEYALMMEGDISDDFCPFLSFKGGDYMCSIHEIKPEMCKSWPLSKGNETTIRSCMEVRDCQGKLVICNSD